MIFRIRKFYRRPGSQIKMQNFSSLRKIYKFHYEAGAKFEPPRKYLAGIRKKHPLLYQIYAGLQRKFAAVLDAKAHYRIIVSDAFYVFVGVF